MWCRQSSCRQQFCVLQTPKPTIDAHHQNAHTLECIQRSFVTAPSACPLTYDPDSTCLLTNTPACNSGADIRFVSWHSPVAGCCPRSNPIAETQPVSLLRLSVCLGVESVVQCESDQCEQCVLFGSSEEGFDRCGAAVFGSNSLRGPTQHSADVDFLPDPLLRSAGKRNTSRSCSGGR